LALGGVLIVAVGIAERLGADRTLARPSLTRELATGQGVRGL